MAITLHYKDFRIELFDHASSEDTAVFNKIYQPEKDQEYQPVSQTGIIVYKGNTVITSALLSAVAGATSVTTDSVIIEGDNLITRCCNSVFSITIPDLKLNWMTEADWATCFSLHPYNDSFITHGEVCISRIDYFGKILWQFSGADIFVNLESDITFEMHDNHIALTDFIGGRYKIDFEGKLINEANGLEAKKKNSNSLLKTRKPWWKFW
jgi:hypothetical protein